MTTDQYEIKVYKVWWEEEPSEFYIGSTRLPRLCNRMKTHRTDCERSDSKFYNHMREKGKTLFNYIQITSCMVSNKDQQRMVEQVWIDHLMPTLNSYRAYRTKEDRQQQHKEFEETHVEHRKQYQYVYHEIHKQYRKVYQETRKNIQTCICGSNYNFGHLADRKRHYKSKKHISHVQLIWAKLK